MTAIRLHPSGRVLTAEDGSALRDVLFEAGVEFACGGRGICKGCKVKLLAGALPPLPADYRAFSAQELREGWRLSCRHTVQGDVTLELAQWEMEILADSSSFPFTPQEGFGIAIDLGTTTLAAQRVDLKTGAVLATRTALNAQARHGADLISRLSYALAGGAEALTQLIRAQTAALVAELGGDDGRVVIAGNTVMHHLFAGLDVTPLAVHPFEPLHCQTQHFRAGDLGWQGAAQIDVLPCIGGLVGGDVLAGLAATGLETQSGLTALIDLGTNGEVVVASDGVMVCASTAAGPAFEGARIHHGMRAASGAIDAVSYENGQLLCRVIGGGAARGLCGSGLVDAVAAGLDSGAITASGRLAANWPLRDGVMLNPQDVRELQLAKGAIAAGLGLLTARFGAGPAAISRLYLAGAFGNGIDPHSAQRIGLLPSCPIVPVGNTALKGAKMALFGGLKPFEALARRVQHVPLAEDPGFEDAFAGAMRF